MSAIQPGAVGINDYVVQNDLGGVAVLVEPHGDAVRRDVGVEPDVDPFGLRPDSKASPGSSQ